LIKTHFVNTIKDYYRDLKNIGTVNLVGITLEDYPIQKEMIDIKAQAKELKDKEELINKEELAPESIKENKKNSKRKMK
jgi:hypothetical protein